ncbi:MAG: O-antigen ligase family protein [Anaerolineae bacterium]|nr:O-antigen ligase family protein [Anaerolineae bacterium]
MRLGRIAFILIAIYIVFIGGSAYYTLIFPVRVLHHALMTIVLGLWLLNRVRSGHGMPQTPLNYPLLGVSIVWIISAIFSLDPRMAFEHLWFPLTHIILFFIIVDLFQRGRDRLVLETQFMLAAAVVLLSLLELVSWYFGLGIIPGTNIGWIDVIGPDAWLPLEPIRLSLAMNISTLLAGYVAPLVTLAGGWALTTRRRDFRVVLWGLAGALFVVLILTFSRGGLLSILTAVGIIIAFRLAQTSQFANRSWGRLLIGGVVTAGILVVSLYSILSITQSRISNTGDAGRLDMWQSATEMARYDPFTGVGPGLFGRAFRFYRDPTIVQDKLASAHNAYLNTLAETGIPGIVVSLWLGVAFLRALYRNWKIATLTEKYRLEIVLAALIGLAIHSLVDVFTITPIVLMMIVLVAYGLSDNSRSLKNLPSPLQRRLVPVAALITIVTYGLWFIQLDRAQSAYQSSFGDPKTAYIGAHQAISIDPVLNLYALQNAYLQGQDRETAIGIEGYKVALEQEPTWDVGWMNLAALELRSNNPQNALTSLDRARQINTNSPAVLHWAVLAEILKSAPDTEIITAYITAMRYNGSLPLSDFWWATDLRQTALEQYIPDLQLDYQYRILTAYDPSRALEIVPKKPITAAEWWVTGEYALTIENNLAVAENAFTQAIQFAPTNGDYYVSRARATYATNPASADRDLKLATLLGAYAEYPNAVWAEFATTPQEAERLRANALPPRQVVQEFSAVLYNRSANFDLLPEMRRIGPGRAAMQPWYTIAEMRLAAGNTSGAINAYRAILDYAPDETQAREQLTILQGQ